LAIGQFLSTQELESDQPASGQENNWVPSLSSAFRNSGGET
jgi:hypothetical protein